MSKINQEKFNSILNKFEIKALNPMQEKAGKIIRKKSDVVLLSPTGTGKTLAFLLPLIESLDTEIKEIQALILVPSRELAQQIEQVVRKMGSGFKVNSVYGGRAGSLDKLDLKHKPAILIGTPGRVVDRFRRDKFALNYINTLILDEFDKSLEVGFENEMTEIIETLPNVHQRILTSATTDAKIPKFVGLQSPVFINFLQENKSQLVIKTILSPDKDKLKTLENVSSDKVYDFEEGLAQIRQGDNVGFINTSGTVVVAPKFNKAFDFKNGYAKVRDGETWGLIDKTGNYLVNSNYSDGSLSLFKIKTVKFTRIYQKTFFSKSFFFKVYF